MTDLIPQIAVPESVLAVVTQEQLKLYAVAAGDPNPIHQDEAVAKAMGLPGVIAHGMYVAGLVHSHALRWASEQPVLSGPKLSVAGTKTRFRGMTFLGDEVRVSGHAERSNANEWRLDLAAKNQKGETLVTCQILLRSGV